MKTYVVFSSLEDFKTAPKDAYEELESLMIDREIGQDAYVTFSDLDFQKYPVIGAFIKERMGDSTLPVLINIWW